MVDRLDDAGAPEALIVPTAAEAAFDLSHQSRPDGGCAASPCGGRFATWPSAAVFDPDDGGTALVFYQLISAAPGAYDFGLYSFACPQSGFDYPCQLARVPFVQALDKAAWQYWDGAAWSAGLSSSRSLFDGAPILSFFFDTHIGQWLAVYSKSLSNEVAFRTAPQLTGPWSSGAQLFVADPGDGGGVVYDAYVHPELSEQGDSVQYVTYSRGNGTAVGDEFVLEKVVFQ